jgi:hypothetical protein
VTEIGEQAFAGCTGLKSIEFPKSVKTIGRRAFENSGITDVVIPKSVKKIGDMAFVDCHDLKSISIMGSLESKKDVFKTQFLWKVNRIKTDFDWAHPGRDWEPVELKKLLKVIPAEKKK